MCKRERKITEWFREGDNKMRGCDSHKNRHTAYPCFPLPVAHLQNNWQYSSCLNTQSLVKDVKLPLFSEQILGEHLDKNTKTNKYYSSV